MITAELISAGTGAPLERAALLHTVLVNAMERFDIVDKPSICAFLSQIGHESGGLSQTEESLNYRVSALQAVFGRSRISEEDAKRYGRDDATGQKANQEALANILYGGEFGRKNLGNTEPGDGWRFRGRGYKQLTGRYNYTKCAEGIGLDIVEMPELLREPHAAALSAAWFYASLRGRGVDDMAVAGDVAGITKLVNGGNLGLDQRTALFNAALAVA